MNSLSDIRLIESKNFIKVIKHESGNSDCIALSNHGQVYTWADNHILDDSSHITQHKPKILNNSVNNFIIDVCCGCGHTLLLNKFGEVYAFCDNNYGQLGCGTHSKCVNPTNITFLQNEKIKTISCGGYHSLALSQSGVVFTWGANDYGQLGINSLIDQQKPVEVEIYENNEKISFIKIECGTFHSLLLSTEGNVYLCGGHAMYYPGETFSFSRIPKLIMEQKIPVKVEITQLKDQIIADISAKYNKSIALSLTGKFYIWGIFGECGLDFYFTPTEIEAKSFGDIYENICCKHEKDSYSLENHINKQIEANINVNYIKCVCTDYKFTVLSNTGKVYTWNDKYDNFIGKMDDISHKPNNIENSELVFPEKSLDICCEISHVMYLTKEGNIFTFNTILIEKCDSVLIDQQNLVMQSIMNELNLKFYDKFLYYSAEATRLEIIQKISLACVDYHSLVLTCYGSDYNLLTPFCFENARKSISSFSSFQIFSNGCFTKIACGAYHSFVLLIDGCLYGFGHNKNGQIGDELMDYCHFRSDTYKDKPKFKNEFEFNDISFAHSETESCFDFGNCIQRNLIIRSETPIRSLQETISVYIQFHDKNINDKIKRKTHSYQWFQCGSKFGNGNFSTVVKTSHILDQKNYAVRVRAISYEKIPEIWKELSIWVKLRSDYVTQVYDFWIDENTRPYSKHLMNFFNFETKPLLLSIQTDFCDSTLNRLMVDINTEFNLKAFEKLNTIAYFIASQIFIEILEGVNFLHRQNPQIIHRDLKPDNILLKSNNNSNNFVRINDFGLSSDHNTGQSHDISAGTPKYRAPDIIICAKSDLYSLGIVMTDLFHIDICDLDDYQIDSNNLVDRKYKHSAILSEQLLSHIINLRPDCETALNNKHLWSMSGLDIVGEYGHSLPVIENSLLKEIFSNKVNLIPSNKS